MIPIADPQIGEREVERVQDVIREGRFVAGEEVERFEAEFAEYVGAEAAVATATGTAALHAALEAAGIGDGDRVVTTPFSFVATANAVRFCGAEPVFADVDPETLNLDPDQVEGVVREQDVDAILVVHLYGLPAQMERFVEIADEHDLTLIEDAAQAHGATIGGDHVGTVGDAGCFSFYPTKNMTTGEGGMVVTDDPALARRVRQYGNHGRSGTYTHARVGQNYRMTNIAAAIGLEQLAKLPYFVDRRRRHAARLLDAIGGLDLGMPARRRGTSHAFHQFTVRARDRESLRLDLQEREIGTGIYYPKPIHRQPAYDAWRSRCPVAERAATEVLSLPVHPGLTEADVDTVAAAVRDSLSPVRGVRE